MKPGTAIVFDATPAARAALPPSFPTTVSIGLLVGDFVLTLHYWIPTPEAADMLAEGRWR